MKHLILSVLKRAGWALRRMDSVTCPTMSAGLLRIASNNFKVQTVLDVGASNGSWSKECMTYFPNADYVLFEPQSVHNAALDAFAKACGQKVTLVKKAVGATEGETYFDATNPFGGVLLSSGEGEGTIKVPLTTIDACVAQQQVAGPFLLKLDTHGYERSILNVQHGHLKMPMCLSSRPTTIELRKRLFCSMRCVNSWHKIDSDLSI